MNPIRMIPRQPPTVLPAASLPARQSQISSVPVASSEIAQPVKPAPFPLDTNSNGSSPKPPDNAPAAPTEVILSLRGDLKLELVLINAGEFEMGSMPAKPALALSRRCAGNPRLVRCPGALK
jgi:hypothetical protein